MSDKPPMCIIHRDEDGFQSLYFTEGVLAYWVEETCPSDRVFQSSKQLTHNEIIALIGPEANIGRKNDGSPAATRLSRAISNMEGESHLKIVSSDEVDP